MSDYTPTLEDAKRTYAYIQGGLDHDEGYKPFYQVHEDAFDRMIAEVERAAAVKALADAADELERANASPNLIELESRYAGFYSGIRSTTASNVEKLRARAAALGLTAGQEGEQK